MELHTIELNKFDSGIEDDFQTLLAKMKQKIDIWCAFLTRYDLLAKKQNELPKEPNYADLKKALHIIEVMNFSDEERNSYEDHLKWLRDESSALEKKFRDGEAIGIEKGRAEGIEETKISVVYQMLHEKMALPLIAKMTGLSLKNIEKLHRSFRSSESDKNSL